MASNASVILTLQSQVGPQVTAAAEGFKLLAMQQQLAELRATRYAQAQLNVARADQQLATATQRTATATAQTAAAQARAEITSLRLATAQEKAAQATSGAGQYLDAFKTGLLSFAAPMAVFNTAMGLITGAVASFKNAFVFTAELQQTNAAIGVLLGGVRDTGQVFAQARAFADRYKLTQQETSEAILASNQIIRASKAPIDDILTTLSRLRVLNPKEDFAGAARALSELNAGQIISIVDRFNIARSAANAMKKEIEGGGDAVTVLATYLDTAGVSVQALKNQTTGATGAMRDLAKAQEDLTIAQGKFATGPGITIVQGQTGFLLGVTAELTGKYKEVSDANQVFIDKLRETGDLTVALTARNQALSNSLGGVGVAVGGAFDEERHAAAAAATERLRSAGAFDEERHAAVAATSAHAAVTAALAEQIGTSQQSTIAADTLKDAQTRLANLGDLVRKGLITAAIGAEILEKQYGFAHDAAQKLIVDQAQIAGQQAKPAIVDNSGAAGIVKASQDYQKSQAAIVKLQRDQTFQLASTAGQVKILKSELDKLTPGTEAYVAKQTELLLAQKRLGDEQTRSAKAHTSELSTQLNLEESIRDSKEKQLKASLDAAAAAIRDRQDRRKEDQEIAQAQRILSSGRASQAFKGAAADRLALIGVERQQRALAIGEQLSTAGGQIVGGKVLQSRPGAIPTPGALGLPGPAGGAATGGGIEVLVYLDGQQIAANVVTRLRGGLGQAQSAGAGRG